MSKESALAGSALSQEHSRLRRWVSFNITRRLRTYGAVVCLDVLLVACAFDIATVLRYVDTGTLRLHLTQFYLPNLLIGVIYAVISYAYGLHRRLWRYASVRDIAKLVQALATMVVVVGVLDALHAGGVDVPPWSVVASGTAFALFALGSVKILPRLIAASRQAKAGAATTRVLIVGAGDAGALLANRLLLNRSQGYVLVAFVDDETTKWNRHIHGRPVYGPIDAIPELALKFKIDLIAIAIPSASAERISQLLSVCQQTSARIQLLPGLNETIRGRTYSLFLREVNVADLLGREVVSLQAGEAQAMLHDKVIMVTGAAGSIGSELCRQLLDFAPRRLIALDNNETGLFDLAESLSESDSLDRLYTRIGDVTSQTDMASLFREERPEIVFHAAAYKHVPLLERHPHHAVRTNVLGTYRLCRLAQEYAVSCFVFISSDKAADPVNVLGASKRIGELIVQAMARDAASETRFCAVRFGNVIGSRGSVVPTFMKQIERGGPITVTDPETTRFFMTIPEACGLVVLTSTLAESGSLFLLDMGEPVRIVDLATKMTRLRGLRVDRDIAIRYTGLRPGERLHEMLTSPNETLVASRYEKILHLVDEHQTPSLDSLRQRLAALEERLELTDGARVREELFALADARVPVKQR
jgi:FlaA1/EpsC-like NDP-sugar epimerase